MKNGKARRSNILITPQDASAIFQELRRILKELKIIVIFLTSYEMIFKETIFKDVCNEVLGKVCHSSRL